MTQIVDEMQVIFEQNVISEFFLQQPQLLLRRAETQQEELKYGVIALLEQPEPWNCADVVALCREICPQWYQQEPKQGWLEYSYWYIISWSYPDSVLMEFPEQFQNGVQFFIRVLRCMLDYVRMHKAFDRFSDFEFLDLATFPDHVIKEEYERFLYYFRKLYLYELMYIGKEIFYFNTLSHIAGVHYVAMHVARQLKEAGVPVNLALVSGAAVGHDIGKFGCKAAEMKRMPHLHYYYTGQWFEEKNMPTIAHIAVNHSTWDLELENLPLESLILIYADFRVRREDCDAPKEKMGIFSLEDSFHIILSKLEHVDAAKERRYRYVYAKLKDFEDYMCSLGVNIDLSSRELQPVQPKDIALVDAQEAIVNFKFLAIRHNIWLMEFLNTETSFGTLLEAARSEKDWKNTRAYIHIFEEYYTYMTQRQKSMTLNFLYELLMHREGDIRRQAAALMGKIIVRYDEINRKALPDGVTLPVGQTTSLTLWQKYINMIIMPDHKITERHKRWLGYTLKNVVTVVLENSSEEESYQYLDSLLYYYHEAHWDDETGFVLMDTLISVPLQLCEPFQLQELVEFTQAILQRPNLELQAAALRFLQYLSGYSHLYSSVKNAILAMLSEMQTVQMPVGFRYNLMRIYRQFGADDLVEKLQLSGIEEQQAVSELFLENLKVATPWMLKLTNIDFLLEVAQERRSISLLQVAAHLSNILKVGERISVRHRAGQGLVSIAPLLSLEERNELVIELTKGLEIGEYEFSKYIPEYLGQIALYLQPQELDEIIQDIQKLLRNANNRVVSVALNTLGVMLEYYPAYQQRFGEDDIVIEERRRVILGMLLSGLSSYDEEVNSEAFIVLGHQLFGSVRLSLEEKYKIFYLIYKRMLILIHDKELNGLSFFNRAGSLNHIYRFISDYLMEYGRFDIPEIERIAFFPGTFDPFSSSHKGIVQEIRNLGFQVYLALDEFSWSKKTQPRMTRRQIIVMSVADEENVYLFPDDIPINLANDGDMARLHSLFPGKEVYIVVGSDVILNASSYKKEPKPGSIHSYNHIVFRRAQGMDAETTAELEQRIEQTVRNSVQGDLIYLTLPTYLEDISSTRIRENIDCNRDISNLISPLAQNYIYHYGLYLREPQYKPILQAKNMKFDFVTEESSQEVYQLLVSFSQMDDLMDILSEHWQKPNAMLTLLKDSSQEQRIVAFALSYTLETTDMYGVFQNAHVVEWLRKRIFGKIAVLTGIYQLPDIKIKNGEQLLLTETISHYLEQDYGYSIYYGADDEAVESVLQRQGFLPAPMEQKNAVLYLVDMRSPLTLLKNIETTIKEPFNRNERLLAVVEQSHHRLQEIMTELYPGNLVLSIDAGIMHHKMLQKITRANHVPNEPLPVRKLGKNMCVPFGKILRGMVVPNTVTKTLHSEKVYDGAIKQFSIQNFPFYSTLENQVRTIKSFDRPVILVDDLLHKGYRIQGLWPILEQEQVQVDRMVVGILSARGKDLIGVRNCPVESAYFLPRLRGWYVESTLYPFIGGDMVARQEETDANLIPSVNFILPYVVPSYMRDVQRDALYYFSLTCLQNVHDILQVLEEEYQKTFGRRLTLGRLGEAIISPRCPDRGNCGQYDKNIAASVYVEDDIQRLVRLESIMAK